MDKRTKSVIEQMFSAHQKLIIDKYNNKTFVNVHIVFNSLIDRITYQISHIIDALVSKNGSKKHTHGPTYIIIK